MKTLFSILVCLKQTPDPDSPLGLDPATGWVTSLSDSWVMGRLDAHALEEALLLKEALETRADCRVDVVSLGPPRVEVLLRRALGMGADRAFWVPAPNGPPPPGHAVARHLAGLAGEGGYSLVVAGAMADDSQAAMTGPAVARILGMPWATFVVEMSPEVESGVVSSLKVTRELEGGDQENLSLGLPALVTIQSTVRRPRYPKLSRMLWANKQEIKEVPGPHPLAEDKCLGLVFEPDLTPRGEFLEGSAKEKAEKLRDILIQRGLL